MGRPPTRSAWIGTTAALALLVAAPATLAEPVGLSPGQGEVLATVCST